MTQRGEGEGRFDRLVRHDDSSATGVREAVVAQNETHDRPRHQREDARWSSAAQNHGRRLVVHHFLRLWDGVHTRKETAIPMTLKVRLTQFKLLLAPV